MLENLKRLINYCQTISADIPAAPEPRIVAAEDQGTTALNSPAISGPQIVIALPSANLSGNCDSMAGPHTFIIFSLEKGKTLTTTQNGLTAQYLTAADLMDAILEKFMMDIGGDGASDSCSLLAGMELVDCDILPEAGRFGDWNGWSATLTLK